MASEELVRQVHITVDIVPDNQVTIIIRFCQQSIQGLLAPSGPFISHGAGALGQPKVEAAVHVEEVAPAFLGGHAGVEDNLDA